MWIAHISEDPRKSSIQIYIKPPKDLNFPVKIAHWILGKIKRCKHLTYPGKSFKIIKIKNSSNALKEGYIQKKKVGGWDYKLVLGFLFL